MVTIKFAKSKIQHYWIFLDRDFKTSGSLTVKSLMNFGKLNSKIFGSGSLNFGCILSDRLVTVKGRHWFRNLSFISGGGNEQVIIVFPNHLLVRTSQREPLFEPNWPKYDQKMGIILWNRRRSIDQSSFHASNSKIFKNFSFSRGSKIKKFYF